ncbi:MAG: peptidoglycan-binding protein [Patescibacteria group bacterium]
MKKILLLPIGAGVAALVLVAALITRANAPSITITGIDGKTPNAQNTITDPISQTPVFTGEAPAGALVSIYNQTPAQGTEDIAKIADAANADLSISKSGGSATFTDDFSGPYSVNWLASNTSLINQNNGALELRAGYVTQQQPTPPGGGSQPPVDTTNSLYSSRNFPLPSNGTTFVQGTITIPQNFQLNSNGGGGHQTAYPRITLDTPLSPTSPDVNSFNFNPDIQPLLLTAPPDPKMMAVIVWLQQNNFIPQVSLAEIRPDVNSSRITTGIPAFEQAVGLPSNVAVAPGSPDIYAIAPATATAINTIPRVKPATQLTTTLGVGSTDADQISALQTYLGIPSSGTYDPATQTAVEAFQTQHGLPTTGLLDDGTLHYIYLAPVNWYKTVNYQVFLAENGLPVSATGIFDPATQTATNQLQSMLHVPQTSVLDQATIDAITTFLASNNNGGGQQSQHGPLDFRFGVRVGNTNQGQQGGELSVDWSSSGSVTYQGNINGNQGNMLQGNLPMTPGTYTVRIDFNGNNVNVQINNQTVASGQSLSLQDPLYSFSPYFSLVGDDQGLTFGFDDFSSSLALPATYSMAATGMQYGNVSYADPVPFENGNPAGIVVWSDQSNLTVLPLTNVEQFPISGEVYVYLTTLTIPAGALGNNPETKLRWTNFAGDPQVFKQTVDFINTQVGFNFVVDAYAKAFSRSGDTFTPVTFPMQNVGQIDSHGILLPPANTSLLLARATTASNGQWTATFGKDENGADIAQLIGQTLAGVAPAPYAFVVYASLGGNSAYSVTPIIATSVTTQTDTVPPTSTATITGTTEPVPYASFYKDQATVTISATDNDGGSGVQKIMYSLSGAVNRTETEYTAPIVLNTAGETTITFHAIDNAGNGESPETMIIRIDKDSDGDQVYDNLDSCALVAGIASINGCPVAISLRGRLDVKYAGKSNGYAAIVNGKQKKEARISLKTGDIGDSRDESVTAIVAKVYNTKTLKTGYGKNLGRVLNKQCSTVFDTAPALLSRNIQNADTDLIGVPGKSDYVIATRITITEPDGSTIESTVCRSIAARAFRWNQTATGFDKLPGNKLGQGTIARPRVKFTKSVKPPKVTCEADEDQDSPDDNKEDNNRDNRHRDDDGERDVSENLD